MYGAVAGGGLIITGGAVIGGTIIEDFGTGGVEMPEDPVTIGIGGGLIWKGFQLRVGAGT